VVKLSKIMSENQLERRFIENCEKMSFEELGNYISNCLDKIKTHKNTLKANPNNLATYDELIKLIESKILDGAIQKVIRDLFIKDYNEQKKYDIYELNKKFDNPQEQFDELIRNRVKKGRLKEMRKKLAHYNLEKEKIEIEYKQHQNLLEREYFENESYRMDLDYKVNKKITERQEFIVGLRSKKRKIFDNLFQNLQVKKLPWKFFPKGEWTVDEIIKSFSKYATQNETVDEKRLRKIVSNLEPSVCYISEDGFNRYIAFCFDWTEKVILECPIYGNAIYIIKGDWQKIARMSKWEARYEYSNQVTVIRHNETWFERLKSNLKAKY